MIDCFDLIKQSVTMPQVLSMYGLPQDRYHRIPCPIHGGKNKNMQYWDDSFYCFKCNAHGTVIDFVMQLFSLDLLGAVLKLDQDFNLGLGINGKPDEAKQAEAERISAQRRAERKRREEQRERLHNAYHAALDKWVVLDKIVRTEAPATPYDDLTEQYAYAVKHIDAAGAELDEAEINLWEFEHEGRNQNQFRR